MDVRLRDVVETDLPIYFEHQRDPAAVEMADFPARDAEAFAAHWAKILADPVVITMTVEADGEVAGGVVSWLDEGRRCVGYGLGRAFWGRGIATEALLAFLARVTDRPLHAYVAVANVGSQRVLEKCGFTFVERDEEEILYELR